MFELSGAVSLRYCIVSVDDYIWNSSHKQNIDDTK